MVPLSRSGAVAASGPAWAATMYIAAPSTIIALTHRSSARFDAWMRDAKIEMIRMRATANLLGGKFNQDIDC